MRFAIENKILLGFIVSVIALALTGWLSYRATARLTGTLDMVAHSHEVIANVEALLANLTEVESEQRGYLLTGSTKALSDSEAAHAELLKNFAHLRRLTSDNPKQQGQLDQLEPLIARRIESLKERIQIYQRSGLQTAADATASGPGKVIMDEVKRVIAAMHAEEHRLLLQREQAGRDSSHLRTTIIACSNALAIAVVLVAVTLIRRDLHLREQAELKLQESRALMESILDNTPAIVFLKDLDGRYLFVNRRFEQVAKKTRDDLRGKTISDIASREQADQSIEHQRIVLEKQSPVEFEEIVEHLEGPRPHLAVKFPIRDTTGKIYAIAGISMDIAERKKAEVQIGRLNNDLRQRAAELEAANKELQHRRAELQSLFESLPGLYLILKPDFQIVTASDAYLNATMTTREAIRGRNLFEVFPDNPEETNATGTSNLRASLNRVLQNRKADTMAIQKYDVRRPDGVFEERYWSPVNSPVFGGDRNIEYIIHRVEDVTEFVLQKRQTDQPELAGDHLTAHVQQIEAEIFKSSQQVQAANRQLHAANKELEAFSYSVSHDLRAPLRHIDGFVDLLTKHAGEQLDDRGRRYLKIIADAARQMGNLIDDLLVFSRMGRAELRQQSVDMNALVHEAVNNLQAQLNGRNVTWNIDTLPHVQADAAMLRQVFVNLLGNAVKYSRPRNPAVIEVSCNTIDSKDFEFCVRDNGVGFDMNYADKLFGVFQRLHRADEFEGTGIGLANVRRIIARHGGRTWAEGKVDAGAAFYFTLPKSQPNSA